MNKSFTICPVIKAPLIVLLDNHCYQKHDCSDHCKYCNSRRSLCFSYAFDFFKISSYFHKITPVIFKSAIAIPPHAVPKRNAGRTISPRNFNVSTIASIMKSTIKIVFTTHFLKWYLFVYFLFIIFILLTFFFHSVITIFKNGHT